MIVATEEAGDLVESGPLYDAFNKQTTELDDTPEITQAFITGNDEIVTTDEIADAVKGVRGFDLTRVMDEAKKTAEWLSKINQTENAEVLEKTVKGSSQSQLELREDFFVSENNTRGLSAFATVQPPYPPELLASFLEIDETHARCVITKVIDAVGREYEISPIVAVEASAKKSKKKSKKPTEKVIEKAIGTFDKVYSQAEVQAQTAEVRAFIDECNENIGFEGVLQKAAMDYEALGYGAIEVIRSRDFKVSKIAHIPASRVRVLRGWKGFVEIVGPEKYIYYQSFGQKVVGKDKQPFNPRVDGELSGGNWDFYDRDTGLPGATFEKAATEILWVTKNHAGSVYYGVPDIIPAVGQILANVQIRDFVLQYFEHNTIPRYAVIIEGGKISDSVKDLIMAYFSTHVKGKAHKTLIIPIPALRGEVRVRFEKLDADKQEASFQETRRGNSQIIMVAHGVSPAIIGIAEAASLGSGKGLSQAEIYKDRCVTPSQRKWDGVMNKLFKLGLGVGLVEIKHNPLDIRDLESEQRINTAYTQIGIKTINEIRIESRLGEPIEGGDRAFIMTPKGPVFIDELTEETSSYVKEMEEKLVASEQKAAISAAKQQATAAASAASPKKSVPKKTTTKTVKK